MRPVDPKPGGLSGRAKTLWTPLQFAPRLSTAAVPHGSSAMDPRPGAESMSFEGDDCMALPDANMEVDAECHGPSDRNGEDAAGPSTRGAGSQRVDRGGASFGRVEEEAGGAATECRVPTWREVPVTRPFGEPLSETESQMAAVGLRALESARAERLAWARAEEVRRQGAEAAAVEGAAAGWQHAPR